MTTFTVLNGKIYYCDESNNLVELKPEQLPALTTQANMLVQLFQSAKQLSDADKELEDRIGPCAEPGCPCCVAIANLRQVISNIGKANE